MVRVRIPTLLHFSSDILRQFVRYSNKTIGLDVQNYQADESVLRSSDAVEAMEQEYEKSRFVDN